MATEKQREDPLSPRASEQLGNGCYPPIGRGLGNNGYPLYIDGSESSGRIGIVNLIKLEPLEPSYQTLLKSGKDFWKFEGTMLGVGLGKDEYDSYRAIYETILQ